MGKTTTKKAKPMTKSKNQAEKAAVRKTAPGKGTGAKEAAPRRTKPAASSAAAPKAAAKAVAPAKAPAAKSAPAKTAPAKTAPTKTAPIKTAPAKAAAPKPAPAKVKEKEKEKEQSAFRTGDFVVYPTHGVGRVVGIETHEIGGTSLQLIAINFDKDRMILRVPVSKAKDSGLRRLSTRKVMETALATLKGRSRVKRAMWSRRAQEYEAKINSGDPVSIAEVIRDLHRNADQPDQSYSERQIYQAAVDRLVRELAAVEDIDEAAATKRLEQVLKAA